MWIALSVLVLVAGLFLASCQVSRAGYESAPYQVVRRDGQAEVRDYPALLVVETPMARSGNGDDGSFQRLFRFITGGNEAKQKIAMTTPVFMTGDEAEATMSFVLPTKLKTGTVPKPSDASVRVRELPAGRFAVVRFRGGRNRANEVEALGKLKAWMAKEGLRGEGQPIYGYFDPPWTPPFLRRNEVMLRTQKQ